MRILITGDKHLGLSSDGESRLPEQRRVLTRCVELLEETGADLYVDLGDLFHVTRPGPDAYEAAFEYLRAVAEWSGRGEGRAAFLISGNHEKPTRGDVNALTPLTGFPRFPRVLSTPDVVPLNGSTALLFLPFVTEWEARCMGFESAQAWLDEESDVALREWTPLLVFSHLEVPGATAHAWDVTQRDVGLRIPAALLASERVIRIFAGHIHRYQVLERVTVVGSSVHVDFGEAADPKGAILAEV